MAAQYSLKGRAILRGFVETACHVDFGAMCFRLTCHVDLRAMRYRLKRHIKLTTAASSTNCTRKLP
eukprot:3179131-Rhodomonas_salina.1